MDPQTREGEFRIFFPQGFEDRVVGYDVLLGWVVNLFLDGEKHADMVFECFPEKKQLRECF